MYTSLMLLALSGLSPAADSAVAPSWLTDYAEARKQGAAEKKPVAVFLGSGKDGWTQLIRGGALGVEQNQLLANSYVCLYADQTTPEGKALARSLDINQRVGIVISDHSGQFMAFHHEGDLESRNLTAYLQKYSDSQRVVRTTDSNPGNERRSYYGGATQPAQPTWAPATSSYCPSCSRR
jgi:hypothetical protein